MTGLRGAALGAAAAIGFCPAAAVLVAILYRFPIPLTGYQSGLGAAWPAIVGAVFYLILGGFIVIGGLGAMAGWVATRMCPRRVVPYTLAAAFVIALLGAVSLATLEYVIGTW